MLRSQAGRALVITRASKMFGPRRTPAAEGEIEADHHSHQLLVRFEPGTTRAARGAVEVFKEYHVLSGLQLVQVAEERLAESLAIYQNQSDVRYAEPDYFVNPADAPRDTFLEEL